MSKLKMYKIQKIFEKHTKNTNRWFPIHRVKKTTTEQISLSVINVKN